MSEQSSPASPKKIWASIKKDFTASQIASTVCGVGIAIVALIICWYGPKFFGATKPVWAVRTIRVLIGTVVVGGPFWFWLEFAVLRHYQRDLPGQNFDEFKYAQELSRTFWLSIVAVLAFAYDITLH